MKIYFYDNLNQTRKAALNEDDFTGMTINHNIDDFSSCQIGFLHTKNLEIIDNIAPFDNVFIEDDDGSIIFGGVILGYDIDSQKGTFHLMDHRWVLSRLITDEQITISAGEDILDKAEALVNIAKAKRDIPIVFDRENSEINSNYRADLVFNVGTDIGSALQKIIQTIYARWAMRYVKVGDSIVGKLIIRSIVGVSPEGVGISRTGYQTEDGTKIELLYEEGNSRNNIQDFQFVFDISQYTSRTKIGIKDESGNAAFLDAAPANSSGYFEQVLGRSEGFLSDYNANSNATALSIAQINQTYPRQDFQVTLNPDFKEKLNCGDRISIKVKTRLLDTSVGGQEVTARIDAITYERKEGIFMTKMLVNPMSPIKRTGTTGLLEVINKIRENLTSLNNSYLNDSGA